MKTYIALLRGINVGGNKKVPMAGLRAFAEGLGFGNPRTLLQSGNLIFETDKRGAGSGGDAAALEKRLETEAATRLGLETDFLVREAGEWAGIMARNPFAEMAERDPSHLVVMFLKAAPAAGAVEALRAAIKGPETVHVEAREAYLTYPAGIGESKLTITVIEKHLATRGTARNWNTVSKLASFTRLPP